MNPHPRPELLDSAEFQQHLIALQLFRETDSETLQLGTEGFGFLI